MNQPAGKGGDGSSSVSLPSDTNESIVELPSDTDSDLVASAAPAAVAAPAAASAAPAAVAAPAAAAPTQSTLPGSLSKSCCRFRCLRAFGSGPLGAALFHWRASQEGMSRDAFNRYLFQLLRDMRRRCILKSKRRWLFLEQCVCRTAWRTLVGIGSKRLSRLVSALDQGFQEAPRDLRRTVFTGGRERPSLASADGWLQWAYEHLAEPFADHSLAKTCDLDVLAAPAAAAGLPAREWVAAPGCSTAATASTENVRFLPAMSFAELFELYQATSSDTTKASRSTFRRCYRTSWKKTLKFRHVGVQSKCPDCERFKEFRRQATSPEDAAAVSTQYRKHLSDMHLDRTIDARIAALAEKAVAGEVPREADDSILSCCLDGMDQAKFRVPRNLSLSKDFQNLWRPELHTTGAICDGVLESYWLAGPDVSKDSNLQVTLVSRLLEQTVAALAAKGIPMPSLLRVHTDNATSEGKNQTMMKFCAWLIFQGAFRSVEMSQFRVGHTHNKQDQRFGSVAMALARATQLEVSSRT